MTPSFTDRLKAAKAVSETYKSLFPHKGMSENDMIALIHYTSWMPPPFTLELIERYEALEGKLEKAKKFLEAQIESHRYNGAEDFRRTLKELGE